MKTIFKCITGSHLYGTNTQNSDKDYLGIFIPDKEYVFGLNSIYELNESIVDKLENGKNSSNAIDCKLYEIRNFVKLALQNNPNIVELFFIPENKILEKTGEMNLILQYTNDILYNGVYDRFMGYAVSQKHKMIIKPNNYNDLLSCKNWLETLDNKSLSKAIIELKYDNKQNFIKFNDTYAVIGDLNIQLHVKLSKIYSMITDRINKASHRTNMFTTYGYDTKFASHVIRLLEEGIQLLNTGKIEFPLVNGELITDIKLGKYKISEVFELIEQYENKMRIVRENSILPKKANFNKVNEMLINLLEKYYGATEIK